MLIIYQLHVLINCTLHVNLTAGAAQTNTTRLNPTSDTRPQAPTGLGGLGLPDLDSMFSAMPDAAMVTQLMQNPAISQMMQSFMSSPQYMNQV